MTAGLGLMNILSRTTESAEFIDSAGKDQVQAKSSDFKDIKAVKKGFKELFFLEQSRNKEKPVLVNKDGLDKLLKLLKLSPKKAKKELEKLDLEQLQGLNCLLNLPFPQLIQGINQARGCPHPDRLGDSSVKLKNSLLGLRKLITETIRFKTDELKMDKPHYFKTNQEQSVKGDYNLANPQEERPLENRKNKIQAQIDFLDSRQEKISLKDKMPIDFNLNKNSEIKIKGQTLFENHFSQDDRFLSKEMKKRMKDEKVLAGSKPSKDKSNHISGKGCFGQSLEKGLIKTFQNGKVEQLDEINPLEKRKFKSEKTEGNMALKYKETRNNYSDFFDQSLLKEMRGNSLISQSNSAPSQIDMDGLIDQITEQIKAQHHFGNNELELQLEPQVLGKVRLYLRLEDGEVLAKLMVENQQVKDHLEQNLQGLKTNLINQGFGIDQINIEAGNFDASQTDNFDSNLNQYMSGDQEYNQDQEYPQEQGQNGKKRGFQLDELSDLALDDLNLEEIEDLFELDQADLISRISRHKQWIMYNHACRQMNFLA